jgi:hypothetical protein
MVGPKTQKEITHHLLVLKTLMDEFPNRKEWTLDQIALAYRSAKYLRACNLSGCDAAEEIDRLLFILGDMSDICPDPVLLELL